MKKVLSSSILAAAFVFTGCQSGNLMSYNMIQQSIQRNVTTEQEVRAQFGEPVEVYTNAKSGTRMLVYRYNNSDELKKVGAGALGAVAGGVLGSKIGGGSGQVIASSVGAIGAGALAQNLVTTRQQTQTFTVIISLKTGRVIDYQYIEEGARSQSVRPSIGPGPL